MGQRRTPLIDNGLLERLLGGVADSRYHVMLGAGASLGAQNSLGERLPSGAELRDLLLEEIGLADEDVSLQRAFEAFVSSRGEIEANEFIRNRFSGCVPQPWHSLLVRLPWQAYWTLNVDDVVQAAFAALGEPVTPVTILASDRLQHFDGQDQRVPIVHLHGYVGVYDQRSNPQLVFSSEQYHSALADIQLARWRTKFTSVLAEQPVVVLGAGLAGEIDLAPPLHRGNISHESGLPSFLVRPTWTDFTLNEARRWGFEPIEASAEEFIEYLTQQVKMVAHPPESRYRNRYTDATFVPAQRVVQASSPPHDFYGGHEPQLSDIYANLDAAPDWLDETLREIGSFYDDRAVSQECYLIHGPPFSGKSTGLMRLSVELERLGWTAYHLGGRERLDSTELGRFFADRPSGFLVVDNARWEASEIRDCLVHFRAIGRGLVVLAADRTSRFEYVDRVVANGSPYAGTRSIEMSPSQGFWSRILTKRGQKARLGMLDGRSPEFQRFHLLNNGSDLFTSLAVLEESRGFLDRALDEVKSVGSPWSDVVTVLGIASWQAIDIPVGIVCQVTGISVARFADAVRTDLRDIVEFDANNAGFARLRHRYLGDLIVNGQAKFQGASPVGDLARDVCLAAAPLVDRDAVRNRTVYFKLTRALMHGTTVEDLVGRGKVDDWYAELEQAFSWHARYWEQRALNLDGDLDRALSYAHRAVNKLRDAWTLNTLATVHMRRALLAASHRNDDVTAIRYWREALALLDESRIEAKGRYEHPFVTLGHYTSRLAMNLSSAIALDELFATMQEWDKLRARDLPNDHQLMRLYRRFLGEMSKSQIQPT
jgi:hypothetical protein